LREVQFERGQSNFTLEIPPVNRIIPAGDSLVLEAAFFPQNLEVQTANVTLAYSTVGTTEILRNEYVNRLVGRGAMLKIIVPDFDTVVVGRTRVASVLFVNRGFTNAEVRSIRLSRRDGEYSLVNRNGENVSELAGLSIAVLDTASVVLRCTPRTVGELALNTVRYVANVDSSEARLRAVGRELSPNDVVVRMGIRAVPDSVAPGGTTGLEVYIAERRTGIGTGRERVPELRELLARSVPRVSGAVGYNRNVLTLQNGATTARRVRNTSPQNVQERITIAPTGWNGLDSVMVRIPAVAVAGNTDRTRLLIEAFEWPGMVLDAPLDSVYFTAQACMAGGKRLVTSATGASLSVVAPNPAKDALRLVYTVREDSYVRVELLDLHGNVAQTLVGEEQRAGEYSLEATLKNIPSGAYTVRLQTAGTVLSRQVNVVR
jgi:hypothetical protein